ncbi:MAG: hypothetical protein EOO68_23525 [Moraxellaceae bacterium]|nr:MAG: hypothetical protein EOO68_23525 [Moraxellaceae bacterium]
MQNRNSAHVVVGQRGGTHNTIEGKQTFNAGSQQDDIGNQAVPNGRADIRIVGNANRTLTVYWQPHNAGTPDNWIAYDAPGSGRTPGQLNGQTPNWGNSVYIGLITYAYGYAGVPFSGIVDSLEILQPE